MAVQAQKNRDTQGERPGGGNQSNNSTATQQRSNPGEKANRPEASQFANFRVELLSRDFEVVFQVTQSRPPCSLFLSLSSLFIVFVGNVPNECRNHHREADQLRDTPSSLFQCLGCDSNWWWYRTMLPLLPRAEHSEVMNSRRGSFPWDREVNCCPANESHRGSVDCDVGSHFVRGWFLGTTFDRRTSRKLTVFRHRVGRRAQVPIYEGLRGLPDGTRLSRCY